MKKVLLFVFLVFVGLPVLAFCTWRIVVNFEDKALVKQGEEIIQKVEKFRQKYNKLPDDLSELGKNELPYPDQLDYTKWDSLTYTVSFQIALGESWAYHSDTKKWGLN